MNSFCALLGLPPSGCQVRAQMRFRNAVNSKEIVRRCPRHREEGEDNLTPGKLQILKAGDN